jgi:hypothetical protein
MRFDASVLHPSFKFSAEIPAAWSVEFVPAITAINVYDPQGEGENDLERSRFFIRSFQASTFLTLSTADVLRREETTVGGHPAVRYEIMKKSGVPDFPNQPSWRSARHGLTDVRLSGRSPSTFSVFAHAPDLPAATVEAFLASLRFHNDRESMVLPLPSARERVTKKPFGLLVSPDRSPIQPERFSGYHTGTDFEVSPEEKDAKITVQAICGGPLRAKRSAQGYGGVAVQECLLDDTPIMVIYGHLALTSITAEAGAYLAPGSTVGMLGAGASEDTDGERKHLHLGVRRGNAIVLAGYVADAADLAAWMDPLTMLPEEP